MESYDPIQMAVQEVETVGSSCQYEYFPNEFIGRGAFGVVYKARVTNPGDYIGNDVVAVKAIHLNSRSEIIANQEIWAKTVARLQKLPKLAHSNLAVCHQVRITKSLGGATVEIMMEHYSCDLARFLKETKKSDTRSVTYEKVEGYCRDIAAGLEFLHQQKLIHGDLKPGNILVKDMPADSKTLGIADLDDLVHMQESVTCSGDISQLRGTVRYMSPEMLKKFCQSEAESPGRKTDIWSLGCLMLEIAECCGSRHDGGLVLEKNGEAMDSSDRLSNNEFAAKLMDGYAPFVRKDIPSRLEACIRMCLRQNPESRTSAEALLHKLRAFDANVHITSLGTKMRTDNGNHIVVAALKRSMGIFYVLCFDPLTSKMRILELRPPVDLPLRFLNFHLTIPDNEMMFITTDKNNEDESTYCLWNVSHGMWRSFVTKWKAAKFMAVVVHDMLYYFRQQEDVVENRVRGYEFVAEDMCNGHVKLLRPAPFNGRDVQAVVGFHRMILYASCRSHKTTLELYDPMADEWRSLPTLMRTRDEFSMVVANGCVYLLGGKMLKGTLTADCSRLNISTGTWENIHSLLQPRHQHSSCLVNDQIYVCGGRNAAGDPALSIEVYDTTRNESWSTVKLSPQAEHLLQRMGSNLDRLTDTIKAVSIARYGYARDFRTSIRFCFLILTEMATDVSDSREIDIIGIKCRYSYSNTNFIGSGTFGIVYEGKITERGTHTGDDIVAVKAIHLDGNSDIVTNPKSWEEAIVRLRKLPKLSHENLVPYYQIRITKFSSGATVELLMERCGGDLASLLDESRKTGSFVNKFGEVKRYSRDISSGLYFLHRQGIIHGDLKPANILVNNLPNGDKTLLIGDLDDIVHMQRKCHLLRGHIAVARYRTVHVARNDDKILSGSAGRSRKKNRHLELGVHHTGDR
ncbi:uncharacterized protein LOC129592931 [Paramacrobiotus metropolitanus]|uniref:uncharacterized protein LOC129592931 n=1 Tax=Paramacrobiotus metropolitanus TaxID=2943436 RepID=UPI0024460AAB|nr:uncharacterized protein LOC129592931 [Paramacrobiotus metropolitanus]